MANGIITALLEHKFDMSKMGLHDNDEAFFGPFTSIMHNNVNLTFRISVCAKDSREEFKDCVGLYVYYDDGPTDFLNMKYMLYVTKEPDREPVCMLISKGAQFTLKTNGKLGWGKGHCLPGTLEGLRSEGYLYQDTMLHAFAILFIPEDAFKDPKIKSPASYAQSQFNHHLYLQTETPTATNSPLCNRFEIISNDDRHFWVHKEVLAFNSDTFKQMFDPEKPENAQFDYLREGRLTFKNVSGGALKEMVTYLYLQHTTPEFPKFTIELVPVAEMYGLKGLTLLCTAALIAQAKNEKLDVELILSLTEMAIDYNCGKLKSVCQKKLIQHVNECENLTVEIVLDLATAAHKYGLNDLTVACGQWINDDWKTMSNCGQFSDIFGEIFARLMMLEQY